MPLESRNQLLVENEPAWKQFAEELDEFLPASPAGQDSSADLGLKELTAREHEVLELVAQGLNNGTIGGGSVLASGRSATNVSIILSKLGVNSRSQAIVRAREAGFGRLTTVRPDRWISSNSS